MSSVRESKALRQDSLGIVASIGLSSGGSGRVSKGDEDRGAQGDGGGEEGGAGEHDERGKTERERPYKKTATTKDE